MTSITGSPDHKSIYYVIGTAKPTTWHACPAHKMNKTSLSINTGLSEHCSQEYALNRSTIKRRKN